MCENIMEVLMSHLLKKSLVTTSFLSLACLTLASVHVSAQEKFDKSLEQTISSGTLKGKKDKENKAIEWLGIPYATSERWKAPEDVAKWTDTFDATKVGDKAIQFNNGEVVGQENALNLDVVRPDNAKVDLPVVVFLHGGNNQTGHAQEIKGNTIVNDIDAVYVSINYRLGAFGFNPLEALKTGSDEENSGNYALLDIASALDWVKENIETFGGDKDNVTLTGFSAGGRDVMATLTSPLFKGKYDKAISYSGGMTLADVEESQEIFASAIAPLVVEDGLKANEEEAKSWLLSDSKEVQDYLTSVKADRLAKLMGNAGIRMSVFPHLYKDGNVIPKEGFETTKLNDVPLMLVTGTNEFSLFAAFDQRFAEDFNSGELFKDKEKLNEFLYARQYGGQLYRLSNGVESARTLDKQYTSDIFVSEISYGDNEKVTPKLANSLGAFHGIFEPLLQTPSNYEAFIGDSFENKGAQQLSADFKGYLKNFIRSGNPNSKKLTKWDKWTAKGNEVLSLDASKNKAKIKMISDDETAFDIIEKMKADQSISDETKEDLNKTVLNGRWFSSELDKQ